MDVSMDFLQILRDAGMWDDEVNAIHSPESAAALAVFKDTPEYQTYARLAPYNSMFQRVNLPLVNIYHDFPLTSADEGEPQVYERPLHQMEKELWRKWEGPMEKLDVATVGGGTTGAGAAAALSSSSSAPASSSPVSSSTSPLTSTPLFRSQSSFLSTFHALFLHRLWHASIDWTRFLCVGGSVLRSVLNSEFHDFDAFQEDPAAGLEKQDVDFFWTSSDDFYAFTKCYTAWKKTVRRWMGEENVRVVSETDYVQVVEVRFDEAETKEFVSAPQKPKGAKKKQTGRKGKKTAEVSEEDDDEEEQEDEDDGSEDAKNDASRRLPPGGRIVTFNFIWYDSSLSASSILNIFDLDVCQVAFDGEDCVITPAGLEALRTRTMLNYKLVNSPKDVRYIAPRSRKYVARGFHLYVPLSFQDDVLTSAWEQAVQMTERMKKKMVRVEVHRRQRQKADEKRRKEWQAKQAAGGVSKSKGKRGKAAAAAKKAEDDDEADDDPIDISSIPTPSLTPCDMNTLKLDRSEGRRGHFFEAGRRVLPEIGAYEVGRAEPSDDDEAGDGDDDDDEAGLGEDGQASGGWDGETHYSGFLLNNDSMRVRQAFLEKIVRAENHAGDW
jgi:hypothetical protein